MTNPETELKSDFTFYFISICLIYNSFLKKNNMVNNMKVFAGELKSELCDHILPYWMHHMVDNENGGFYGRIDGRDNLHKDAPKGSVLNARILWTFSAAYKHFKDKNYLNLAARAYSYCISHFINKNNNGIYWSIDYKGKPEDSKNQIYALAFMIYGLSEYYMISREKQALGHAIRLYNSIEKHSLDPRFNGYFEAFDEKWEILEDLRLSEKDANEKKTMNTHLHILEAYTNLYRIWKDPGLKEQLENLIRLFLDRILNNDISHFSLFFNEEWTVKDKTISFGHDIEGSWLLLEAAEIVEDEKLISRVRKVCIEMVDAVIREGIDSDGGLCYETDPSGIRDSDKHWWPQAEAVVGLINAWQIKDELYYLSKAVEVWEFIKKYIIDHRKGEWYFRISKEGGPYLEEDKAGFWKCPYHNSRACLEAIARLAKYSHLKS